MTDRTLTQPDIWHLRKLVDELLEIIDLDDTGVTLDLEEEALICREILSDKQ